MFAIIYCLATNQINQVIKAALFCIFAAASGGAHSVNVFISSVVNFAFMTRTAL